MLHLFPWMCVCDTRWKHLEVCHHLKGAYWGKAYWRKRWRSWHTEPHTLTHTLWLPPRWGNSDRGSPTCHCGSNYPAGSLHGPSPAGLHITNHITEHTHTEYAHWRAGGHAAHPQVHTLYIFVDTHTGLHTLGCAFHPQFTLHKLMARTNRNDVLVQTSCSSQEKHTSLRGCERSCKHAHICLLL